MNSHPAPIGFGADRLLDADEEVALARLVARGDPEARDRLVRSNLRLVASIARSFRGLDVEPDDLFGEGCLGLIRAAESFDPSFGVRFSVYAGHWVRQSMRAAARRARGAARVPAWMHGLLAKWRRAEAELTRTKGRPATAAEVAAELGLSGPRAEMITAARAALRASRGAGPEDDGSPLDRIEDHSPDVLQRLGDDEDRNRLAEALAKIAPPLAKVVQLRSGLGGGDPLTYREIGQRLGFSHQQARLLDHAATAALAEAMNGR